MNGITKQDLTRLNTHKTRTRRYATRNLTKLQQLKFQKAQLVNRLYYNYGLKYLYQHYGISHLTDFHFPNGIAKRILVQKLLNFSRQQLFKKYHINLHTFDYNVQSTNKMLEELVTNFQIYRNKQYGTKYWKKKNIIKYLHSHNCNLTGYGRIKYKRNNNDIISFTFKQNHNQLRLINNYTIHIPYFGNITSKMSLTHYKKHKISEVRLLLRKNGDYELQVITPFKKRKHLDPNLIKNTVGLDVNSHQNKFYCLSDNPNHPIQLPEKLNNQHKQLEEQASELQHFINKHQNDNSRALKQAKTKLAKLKAKNANIINNWQLKKAKEISKKYPILVMEHLESFSMRSNNNGKKKSRKDKNINKKLAMTQPTSFRKIMEDVYEDDGHLLIEINPFDTSKMCNNCHYIYHDLQVGQENWTCPKCGKKHDRDGNAANNIKEIGLNPELHPILQQPKRFPWLQDPNKLISKF